MPEEDGLRFRLKPFCTAHRRQSSCPPVGSRTAAVRRLPVPALSPIPYRPFWADVEYQGLKAMPIGHYLFRIRHPRLGVKIDIHRVSAEWQQPAFAPCPPGTPCEDPAHYWATKFMMHKQDWEALHDLGPPAIPPRNPAR